MTLPRKLRTLRSLKADDRAAILQALMVPLLIKAGFRLVGVARTQKYLRSWASVSAPAESAKEAQDLIRLTRRAQRIVRENFRIEGTCLVRSLTLWALLLRRGLSTNLRVGFRKSGQKLEGHAWIEYGGLSLNEAGSVCATYARFEGPAVFDGWRAPEGLR